MNINIHSEQESGLSK